MITLQEIHLCMYALGSHPVVMVTVLTVGVYYPSITFLTSVLCWHYPTLILIPLMLVGGLIWPVIWFFNLVYSIFQYVARCYHLFMAQQMIILAQQQYELYSTFEVYQPVLTHCRQHELVLEYYPITSALIPFAHERIQELARTTLYHEIHGSLNILSVVAPIYIASHKCVFSQLKGVSHPYWRNMILALSYTPREEGR